MFVPRLCKTTFVATSWPKCWQPYLHSLALITTWASKTGYRKGTYPWLFVGV
jgi:hypothetical protein